MDWTGLDCEIHRMDVQGPSHGGIETSGAIRSVRVRDVSGCHRLAGGRQLTRPDELADQCQSMIETLTKDENWWKKD